MVPNLATSRKELPVGAQDIGSSYVLLGPRQLCQIDEQAIKAMETFVLSQNWQMKERPTELYQFACLLLPNGQIAQSLWCERKRPVQKVRVARNIKVSSMYPLGMYLTVFTDCYQ